jgi:hypothetical protein
MRGRLKRTAGRCVYVTNLSHVVGPSDPAEFAAKCRDAHLDSIWIRAGRGANRDANLGFGKLAAIRAELTRIGIALWGWHVPFCANSTAASKEAAAVLTWATDAELAGIIVDAERTPESPRFQGDIKDAVAYLKPLTKGLEDAGLGIAFSSHDQPSLHADMPFAVSRFHRRRLPAGLLHHRRSGSSAPEIDPGLPTSNSACRFCVTLQTYRQHYGR